MITRTPTAAGDAARHDHAADTPTAARIVPLATLKRGAEARVCDADARCDDCAMLTALGMTKHCPLRVCRTGHSWIVEVDGTRIAIGADLAAKITVEV